MHKTVRVKFVQLIWANLAYAVRILSLRFRSAVTIVSYNDISPLEGVVELIVDMQFKMDDI